MRVIHSDSSATRVVGFNIYVTRFLDAEGQVCAPLPDFARQPDSLRALYRTMVEARVFDKKATALQRAGQLGGYVPRLGHEAVGTAIGGALRSDDIVLPAYRDPATQLLRGMPMSDLFAYWADPAPDNAPASADAHALASRAPRGAQIVLVSGDEHIAAADSFRGLLAATHANLPIVIVATSAARSPSAENRRNIAPLTRKALAAGLHAEAVDGNDVVAARYVLQHAVERARRGGGPTLIEALSWQLHEGADDHHRAPRTEDEIRDAWDRCPIKRLKRYIDSQNLWTIEQEESLLMTAGEATEAAARHFLGSRSGAR